MCLTYSVSSPLSYVFISIYIYACYIICYCFSVDKPEAMYCSVPPASASFLKVGIKEEEAPKLARRTPKAAAVKPEKEAPRCRKSPEAYILRGLGLALSPLTSTLRGNENFWIYCKYCFESFTVGK